MRTLPGNLSKCIVCCDVVSSCLSHGCAACFDAANKVSRQPTLAEFGFTKSVEHRGSQKVPDFANENIDVLNRLSLGMFSLVRS